MMQKRLPVLLLAFVLCAMSTICTLPPALAETTQQSGLTATPALTAPNHPRWQMGNAATATWDEVYGANYYAVNMYLATFDGRVVKVQTGTSGTSIDLQHEIYTVLGSNSFATAHVSFEVAAQGKIGSPSTANVFSERSANLYFTSRHPGMELSTPTNVKLSDSGTLSWDGIDSKAQEYTFELRFTCDDESVIYAHAWKTMEDINNVESSATVDLANEIASAYWGEELGGKSVQVSIRIQALTYDGYNYGVSEYSEYSNEISYINGDRAKLATPTNVALSENGTLSWMNFDSAADNYAYDLHIESDGIDTYRATGNYIQSIEFDGSRATIDLSDLIRQTYRGSGFRGKPAWIMARLRAVAPYGSDTYSDSDYSAYSNKIMYCESEATKLSTPINVTLSEDGVLSWESVDNNAIAYDCTLTIECGDQTEEAFCNSLTKELSIKDSKTSISITNLLLNACGNIDALGSEIQVTAYVQAKASFDDDYADSELSAESNKISYSFSKASAVEAVKLSPDTLNLAKGESVYVGKTVTPNYATYLQAIWSCDPEGIVSVDQNGLVTALSEGSSTVSITIDDVVTTIPVSVSGSSVDPVSPIHSGGSSPIAVPSASMCRLYNPNSGEHFYTASTGERDQLISAGWRSEGIAWKAPRESSSPVFRLYNPNGGDHHYTMSAGERALLISVGWRDEGIGWYSDDSKGMAVLRQYNPNAKSGSHNYTTSIGERDQLVAIGWHDEGVGWYGLAS